MSDVGLIAIMLAAFLLAIGLVRVIGRLIDPDARGGGWADDPPDASEPDAASGTSASIDPGGPQ